ncbi:hypothetical protein GOP47_0001755 [Adiantum capillus-veneris]|uniref:SURF1-like protein n=1 Tax=Adiantum capillus-veneris TaxID=13818 RepID=A0A9D4ZQF1_ADICA|nr:hypothetical protein GOP47_0001755 [Adiantum capillus-veneris]
MLRVSATKCIRSRLSQSCCPAWRDPFEPLYAIDLPCCHIRAWTSGMRYFMTTTGEPSSSRAKGPHSRSGNWRWSGILLFIPGISTFGLGTWQIMRRKWKMELLDHRRERLKDDVQPLGLSTTTSQLDSKQTYQDVLQNLEYKRVQCEGVFLEEKSIFLGPRGRTNHGVTERGYFLITPLVSAEKDQNAQVSVLVNRGWVPGSWRDNPPKDEADSSDKNFASNDQQAAAKKGLFVSLWGSKKQETLQKQPQTKARSVVAVIRCSENPNMFVPPNEPAKGQWFFVDVPAMARAVGLPENTIYVEALRDKSDDFKGKQYPDPKDPETLIRSSIMPNDHLSYAFTWFTLSAATSIMAWKRLSK